MIESVPNLATASLVESRPQPARDGDGFGFDDLLDIVNPFHHLPLIGTAYRAVTGDEIEPAARALGGVLFGGVFGLASALGAIAFEEITGDSAEGMLFGLFDSDAEPDPYRAQRAYASAKALID